MEVYSKVFFMFRESKAIVEELRKEYRDDHNWAFWLASFVVGGFTRFVVSLYFGLRRSK